MGFAALHSSCGLPPNYLVLKIKAVPCFKIHLAAEADLDEHREHYPAEYGADGSADQRRQ
jgi:hypothetical protein